MEKPTIHLNYLLFFYILLKRVIKIDLNKIPEVTDLDNPIIVHITHRNGYEVTKAGVLKQGDQDLLPSTTIKFERIENGQ